MKRNLTTISVDPQTRDYARAHKREGETWGEFVHTLVEQSDRAPAKPGGDRE